MSTIDINKLLRYACEKGASDLHITVGASPVFRIDGELRRLDIPPLTPDDTEGMAREIIKEGMFESFIEQGELDFSYGLPGVSRFRVNAYHQRHCISLVARVVPTGIPTLESLNMPDSLRKFCHKPQGLVLVTGPTGSGKSTSLAAMIDYINRTMRKHIITLEDPIEYLHKHQLSIINQREIGFDTKDFASGCVPHSARIRMLFLLGRCVIWRQLVRRLQQQKPATLFSQHCIRPMLRKQLIVSSMFFRGVSSRKCEFNWLPYL